MPDRLSLPSTLLLVVLAFGLAFAIQAPLGADQSAAESAATRGAPAVKASAPAVVANAPSAEPDLSLTNAGAVPALLDPRQRKRRRVRAGKQASSVRKAVNLPPSLAPAPEKRTTPVRPMPTAAPQSVPPRSTPAPTPKPAAPKRKPTAPNPTPTKPKPKPTPAPTPATDGEFDTSGEPPTGGGS